MIPALLVALLSLAQPAATAPATQPAAPAAFDSYHLVMLVAPVEPPAGVTREQAAAVMPLHRAHLAAMAREGHLLVAGPFGERYDERLRGMCLYRGELGREEVIALAEADPAVEAGLLQVRVMTWYTEGGALEFPAARRLAAEAGE